ncbi:MAG: AAA family ATPase, partial [Burkholderiales bacterium]
YRRAATGVVARYEGQVAQYLGDGLMIYFGWPKAHEDDASRSVLTALDILSALRQISSSVPLRARIGIATGTVVVGQGSGDTHGEGSLAVGETPNLASRLQGVAGLDEIVIAPSTQRLAGDAFHLADLGELTLKGILQPVRAFKVLGSRRVEGRFEASHARQLTPLIGRETEIALLLDRWERAKAGEGQVVMLSAEAGIGKSRVTRALRDRIAGENHTALHYQCSSIHNNSAFYPVIDQFERAAQFASEDTPTQKLAKMDALLAQAQVNVTEIAPLFAAMLSLPTDGYPDLRLSPQQQKERTIAAQVEQVMGLAGQQPVLMVLEDAHWADPSTLEGFGVLLEHLDSSRVLLVITYRPEFSPPWKGLSRVTALTLARLSRKETAVLAEGVSGKPLPPEVLEQILAKTDGVPLFVEELTKAVMESGLMKDAGDRYTVTGPLPPLAIPSSLHDSLIARLDRMAPVKDLIQLGAVIGREFSHRLIAKLSSMPAPQLAAALDQLVTSELVFKRGTAPDAVYVFKHALVQDAAYESILRSRRQQLHANVATSLEKDGQLAQSDPGFLALQFDRAGLNEKAVEWYMKAGHQANLRSANREALHYFERVLALLENATSSQNIVEHRIDAHAELGSIHTLLEGWASERALTNFVEAENLSRESHHAGQRFRILVGLITSLIWRGHASDAKSYTQQLAALADDSGDPVHRLYAHQVQGQTLMYAGMYRKALAESELATRLYDESAYAQLAFKYGHNPGLVALWNAAYMQWETGALDHALRSSEKGLDLGRKIGHAFSLSSALMWTLDLSYFMWLPDRILCYASEAIDFAQLHGFSQMHAMGCFHQGWAHAQVGLYDQAIEQMTHALAQYRATGAAAVVASRLTAQLASVYGQAGRYDEAFDVLESSADRQPGRRRIRYPEISRIEGELHFCKPNSDLQRAEHFFREAIEIAIEDEAKAKHLRAATSLAKLWQSQGKAAEAKALLQPLYDSFTEGFDFPDMKNARAVLESLRTT